MDVAASHDLSKNFQHLGMTRWFSGGDARSHGEHEDARQVTDALNAETVKKVIFLDGEERL